MIIYFMTLKSNESLEVILLINQLAHFIPYPISKPAHNNEESFLSDKTERKTWYRDLKK